MIHRIRQRLPFPLVGLDSNNGSKFINRRLYNYCQREEITFARSRLSVNFFWSVVRLQEEQRHGPRVHPVYDAPRTPYQRSEEQREDLAMEYSRLNPGKLLKPIKQRQDRSMAVGGTYTMTSLRVTSTFKATRLEAEANTFYQSFLNLSSLDYSVA